MQPIGRETLEMMNEQKKEDFVLINVLPREAFREAHIRTSINIPHEDAGFEHVYDYEGGTRDWLQNH